MITFTQNQISEENLKPYLQKIPEAMQKIRSSEMSGWLDLPEKYQNDPTELNKIKAMAHKVQNDSEYLVCIGIGGSYLGTKAIYEALEPESKTKLIFAGYHTSPKILQKVINAVKNHDFSINVISKSGTTLEVLLAFEPLKKLLVEKYGQELAADRIYVTTNSERGTLHDEAIQNNYETFEIPENIGGRFSTLTAVGLFPLAVAGIDIDELISGARAEADKLVELSPAAQYSAFRSCLRNVQIESQFYDTEILATTAPELTVFQEWWKQLFGESEGKGNRNIFPASVIYSTDLHSLGQYLQDGRKNLFETFLSVGTEITPSADPLMSKLTQVSAEISEAAKLAHAEVRPISEILLPALDEKSLGACIYFFELACALSATFQGVNPFDQPGVENYKAKMRAIMAN